MNDPNKSVADRVAAVLGDRTHLWLADAMGVARPTATRLLKAKMAWTADYIASAAKALGCRMADLMPDSAGAGLTDEESVAVLVLRTQGYKGLASLALAHLADPH
jgi:hypothetical protein